MALSSPNWHITWPFDGSLYPPEDAPAGSHSIQNDDGSYRLIEALEMVEGSLVENQETKTALINQRKADADRITVNKDALAYLVSTDWYAVRFAETGEAIPDDVREKRQAAREKISR